MCNILHANLEAAGRKVFTNPQRTRFIVVEANGTRKEFNDPVNAMEYARTR